MLVTEKDLENPVKRKRKRLCNSELWKKNQRKTLYNTGKLKKRKITGTHDNIEDANIDNSRKVRGSCKTTCRIKGSSKLLEGDRQLLNMEFWALGDAKRRPDFIGSHTIVIDTKKPKSNDSRRHKSMFYFLPKPSADRVGVCTTFFLKTLDISSAVVRKAHESKIPATTSTHSKKAAHNKTNSESVEHVKEHMKSFPVMPSHYCSAKSQRLYSGTRTFGLQKV